MNKTTFDIDSSFRDLLNELEPVEIGGFQYLQGDALEKLDPIAFRQGALDYADALLQDGVLEEDESGELVWKDS